MAILRLTGPPLNRQMASYNLILITGIVWNNNGQRFCYVLKQFVDYDVNGDCSIDGNEKKQQSIYWAQIILMNTIDSILPILETYRTIHIHFAVIAIQISYLSLKNRLYRFEWFKQFNNFHKQSMHTQIHMHPKNYWLHLIVIMFRISCNEYRFTRIRYETSFTITTSLLWTYPIFPILFHFSTNIWEITINNFSWSTLSSNVRYTSRR